MVIKKIYITVISNMKVLDFAQTEFDDSITIAEMYDTVKMGMLRFHVCTESNSAKENLPE